MILTGNKSKTLLRQPTAPTTMTPQPPSSPCKRLTPEEFKAAVQKRFQQANPGSGRADCPTCGGDGVFRLDLPLGHPNFGHYFQCPCNQSALEYISGLKTHERNITLNRLVTKGRPGAEKMRVAAERFIARPVEFLSFYGTYGNGKTLALQAIVNGCLERGIEARYLTGKELVLYLREAFDPNVPETDVARINRLATIPVLCIDELAEAGKTPYAREMQIHLINERYRCASALGTVFAWNTTFADLPWPSVVSRLKEFEFIENTDKDLRPKLGEAKQKIRTEAQYVSV